MINRSGKKIVLDVINNIPYLPPETCYPTAPAVDDGDACPGESSCPTAVVPNTDVRSSAKPSEAEELVSVVGGEASDSSAIQESGDDLPPERHDLKIEATSIQHLTTHLPKNPYCVACQRAKLENVRGSRKGGIASYDFKTFGEHITADTIVLRGKKDIGITGDANCFVIYDFATGWLDCFRSKSKSQTEVTAAFIEFQGDNKVQSIYCDRAPELLVSADKLGWMKSTGIPGVPRTNSIAESKVKLVIRGA
jgi:hypothetical protein